MYQYAQFNQHLSIRLTSPKNVLRKLKNHVFFLKNGNSGTNHWLKNWYETVQKLASKLVKIGRPGTKST